MQEKTGSKVAVDVDDVSVLVNANGDDNDEPRIGFFTWLRRRLIIALQNIIDLLKDDDGTDL